MKELVNGLRSQNHTAIVVEENFTNNSPHYYEIVKAEDRGEVLAKLHFQEGPVKEAGVNGIFMEDLIAICLSNLYNFQNSPYACRENAVAITKLEEAMMWMSKRARDREARGVLGTNFI